MTKIQKYLFAIVYMAASCAFLYHIAYAANWTLKYWPEGEVRQWYIDSHAKNLASPFNPDSGNERRIQLLEHYHPDLGDKILARIILSFIGAGFVAGSLFMYPGFRRKKSKFVRGAVLAEAKTLARMTAKQLSRPPITIGGVPIPTANECLHVAIEGTTGTGKSQAIYTIIQQARARGDRGMVLDCGGAYVSRFFKEGDQILSIGDSRSVRFNPFAEIRTTYDFSEIARAAIPDGKGENAGWHEKGRVLFSNVFRSLYQSGDHQISRLVHLIMVAQPEELAPIVLGTPAAIFCQAGNDRVLQSTRAIISTYLQPWSMLPDGGDFSIKEWIRTGQNWLFLSYRDNQLAALRNLLATWLGLAINESLSGDEQTSQRTFLIADEFDTLGKVEATKDALTKLRKYQTSCVLGFQSVSQPRDTYGRDLAQTLLSCLSNKLYLRAGDPETAKYCADDLGQQQFTRTEQSENRKKGLVVGDRSATDAERHVTEHIVMPAELQRLPNLTGYLSLAGNYPVAKVQIPVPDLPRIALPFM